MRWKADSHLSQLACCKTAGRKRSAAARIGNSSGIHRHHVCRWQTEEEGLIRVSGNIEITDAALSFKIAGRVTERFLSEGNMVKKEQLAAKLDDLDLRQEVNLRQAELDEAKAALKELRAGSRP